MKELFEQLEYISLFEELRFLNEAMNPDDERDSKLLIMIANKLKEALINEFNSSTSRLPDAIEKTLFFAKASGDEEVMDRINLSDEEREILNKYEVIPFDILKLIYSTFLPHNLSGEGDTSDEEVIKTCCIYDKEPFIFGKVNLADRLRKRKERYTVSEPFTPYQKIRNKKRSLDRDEKTAEGVHKMYDEREDKSLSDFANNAEWSDRVTRKRDEYNRMKKAFIKKLNKGD